MRHTIMLLAVALSLVPDLARADEAWQMLPVVDTTGIGVRVDYGLSDRLVLRGSASYMPEPQELLQAGGISARQGLMSGVGIGLDLHPFSNGFYVGAGARFVAADFSTNGRLVTQGMSADYNARVRYDPVAPYAALGYRQSVRNGIQIHFEVGAMMMRPAEISVTAEPVTAPHPLLQPMVDRAVDRRVTEERNELAAQAERLNIYPVAVLRVIIPF